MSTLPGDCSTENCAEMTVEGTNSTMDSAINGTLDSNQNGIETNEDTVILRLPKRPAPKPVYHCTPEEITSKRRFWKDKLAELNITKIVAPMVDQSELAFRMLMRAHGSRLTYTPMIHAQLFITNHTYRKDSLAFFHEDRPLIVQFCANDPPTFLAACRLVEDYCDGVDLNLGCPQQVARRGHYGAFLQDEVDLICTMVSQVRDHCKLPISCKIRIREDPQQTIDYARRIVEAGCSMLAVHGRTREMKGADTGLADWSRIRQVVDAVDIPVIANGNIQMPGDIERCLAATGAAAVMSAEGILYNPYLFDERTDDAWKIGLDYISYARRFKPNLTDLRGHLFKICHHSFMEYPNLREKLARQITYDQFEETMKELQENVEKIMKTKEGAKKRKEADELFEKIRTGETPMDPFEISRLAFWISKPYFRPKEVPRELVNADGEKIYRDQRKEELKVLSKETGMSITSIKKREKRKRIKERVAEAKALYGSYEEAKKKKFPPCNGCANPAGINCEFTMCKHCCKNFCKTKNIDCLGHNYRFSHLLHSQEKDGLAQEIELNGNVPETSRN